MPVYPGKIYLKGGTDKTLILNVRTYMIYPFQAPEWVDLRIGFFLSVTKAAADDDPSNTGAPIVENLPAPMDVVNRYWIGVKDSSALFPKYGGATFIGYTNTSFEPRRPETNGDSVLASSDAGVGTTNANFWRPLNNSRLGAHWNGGIWDGPTNRVMSRDGIQQHFPQNVGGAGGYATLAMIRLQRDNSRTRTVTVSVKSNPATHNGDVLYGSDTSLSFLLNNLEAFPATVQQWGPLGLSQLPNALYCYWPFHNSRLRIHSLAFLKVR